MTFRIHWLLCLDPIVFGVWLIKDESLVPLEMETRCRMYYSDFSGGDFKIAKRKAAAIISLDYFDKVEEADGTLYLLKLRKSKIYHVNFSKTFLLFNKYYKKPKLSYEKYKSRIAAYSYPRRVRIISFKQDDYFNIFPMDLLGEIKGSHRYVFGLRHTNVTLSRIIETKNIVVSEFPYQYKEIIYQLGKYHSSDLSALTFLPFKLIQSNYHKFHLPEWIDNYKEIRIIQTINLGSHMLLWGEVINEVKLKDSLSYLYHIHFLQYLKQKSEGFNYPLA